MAQAELSKGRPLSIDTATHDDAPVDGTTEPDMTMSPRSPTGLPTAGLAFGVFEPTDDAAIATAPGFTVTVWVRNPATKHWFAFEPRTGVNFRDLMGTFDIDAAEIYFQFESVDTDGLVVLEHWSQ